MPPDQNAGLRDGAGSSGQALLVLGMHRCGTSAVAGIANLLGAAAPASMIPAADDNPSGFWESPAVIETNQALLTRLGHNWYDCLTFDPALFGPELRSAAKRHIRQILGDEFGAAPLYVVKDPRLSLLLDVWRPALDRAAALICLRHPAEVAGSLLRRDRCQVQVAHALWLHYMLEAERQSRAMPRTIVSYDRLLQDWRGTMVRVANQAGIVWSQSPFAAAEDHARFVDPKYRHHFAAAGRVAINTPPLREWIALTWNVLRASELPGFGPEDLRALDHVHSEFAEWRRTTARRTTVVPREKAGF